MSRVHGSDVDLSIAGCPVLIAHGFNRGGTETRIIKIEVGEDTNLRGKWMYAIFCK